LEYGREKYPSPDTVQDTGVVIKNWTLRIGHKTQCRNAIRTQYVQTHAGTVIGTRTTPTLPQNRTSGQTSFTTAMI
jgi:hypothetical protein